jgi:hypothetical protein
LLGKFSLVCSARGRSADHHIRPTLPNDYATQSSPCIHLDSPLLVGQRQLLKVSAIATRASQVHLFTPCIPHRSMGICPFRLLSHRRGCMPHCRSQRPICCKISMNLNLPQYSTSVPAICLTGSVSRHFLSHEEKQQPVVLIHPTKLSAQLIQ